MGETGLTVSQLFLGSNIGTETAPTTNTLMLEVRDFVDISGALIMVTDEIEVWWDF